jgi:hypothetical protein
MTTWKGVLRSIEADARRASREAERRARELERKRKQEQKLLELEAAAAEVKQHEEHIESLTSFHRECSDQIDWNAVKRQEPPGEPAKKSEHEASARRRMENYKPRLFDKALHRVEKKEQSLANAVDVAKAKDEEEYEKALKDFREAQRLWESQNELATKILTGDEQAYLDVLRKFNPFAGLEIMGSVANAKLHNDKIAEIDFHVSDPQIIPSDAKSLLKSGKLSVKEMSKGSFNSLYQTYVCSSVLRAAREITALLPVEMVIVNATTQMLDGSTGHIEEGPIVSVAVPRETLNKLEFSTLDPSKAMSNFIHKMDFKKAAGFSEVGRLDPTKLTGKP